MTFEADFSLIGSGKRAQCEHILYHRDVSQRRKGGGAGVVADDQGVSVCRWERMKRAAKACVWGWWGDLNKIALVFKKLAAPQQRASALQTGFIGTKANYHL